MNKKRLYIALFLSLTLWASSFPGIKASLAGYSPFELAALRFLVASLTLASVAPWFKVRLPRKQDLPLILALAFVGVASFHVILNYGQVRGEFPHGTQIGIAARTEFLHNVGVRYLAENEPLNRVRR